jgi:hypothetical protein
MVMYKGILKGILAGILLGVVFTFALSVVQPPTQELPELPAALKPPKGPYMEAKGGVSVTVSERSADAQLLNKLGIVTLTSVSVALLFAIMLYLYLFKKG